MQHVTMRLDFNTQFTIYNFKMENYVEEEKEKKNESKEKVERVVGERKRVK